MLFSHVGPRWWTAVYANTGLLAVISGVTCCLTWLSGCSLRDVLGLCPHVQAIDESHGGELLPGLMLAHSFKRDGKRCRTERDGQA